MKLVAIALAALSLTPLFGADDEGGRPVTFGVRAGFPVRTPFSPGQSGDTSYSVDTTRYTIGPAVEFSLSHRLGIEADALFQPLGYQSIASADGVERRVKTTGDIWDFPVLLKYRLFGRGIKPFLDTGPDFRRVTGIDTTAPELLHRFSAGYVVGGGVALRSRHFEFSPEFRYTRWGRENFLVPDGSFHSRLNESKFLIGFTF